MIGDPVALTIVALIFTLAGLVKGVVGLGLPSVSLALLVVLLDLPSSLALMVIPALLTNLWQGAAGGNFKFLMTRLWPFFLLATLMTGLGGILMVYLDHDWLLRLLAGLLIIYAVVGLSGFAVTVPEKHNFWVGPLAGAINGTFAGMTGNFAVPGIMYMQATGLTRDQLVQAMGILFSLSSIGLAVMLGRNGYMNVELGLVSLTAIIPALIGMAMGQRIRKLIAEAQFRRLFFVALILLGCFIIGRTFWPFW